MATDIVEDQDDIWLMMPGNGWVYQWHGWQQWRWSLSLSNEDGNKQASTSGRIFWDNTRQTPV